MALRIIRGPSQTPLQPLMGQTVAVLGFGNQGHAHALNLRESGVHVIVGARAASSSGRRAAEHGFEVLAIEQAAERARLVIMALPDESQPEIYAQQIAPNLSTGATLGFLHGFSIRYDLITPRSDIGVVLVAPKGPGKTLRQRFQRGEGIPCLFSVHQDSRSRDAESLGLAWAAGIGCARAGILCTTFQHETDTDLFGEQAVLCGGMTWLIRAAFETLVQAGYPPELAYLECCHEVKQIADLVYERGIEGMMEAISNTAEFGAYESGPRLIGKETRESMRRLLAEIQDGTFARRFQRDHQLHFDWFNRQRKELAAHPIEEAGQKIRSLMPWLADSKSDSPSESPESNRGKSSSRITH
ncbi:MAG: ketol-acid reductoisomerase [Phycisphaerales bacterium]|nr:ketol-acid reductoisomerase [Phycisphaerales bacterium]MCI0676607.1 ketol-acid reductoisomerase [Phycisphaerales bacterium]